MSRLAPKEIRTRSSLALCSLALSLVLVGAAPALAQDAAQGSLFVGKRVVVTNRAAGIDTGGPEYLISTGQVTAVRPDGSADVAIYPYSRTAWGWDANPATKLMGVRLEGQPLKTVAVSGPELAKLNEPRFTAWVWDKDANGREIAWPKARVVSDAGDAVTVFVYDKTGTSGQERVLTGADLERFRALNVTTKPAPGEATTAIAPSTEQVLRDLNARRAANGDQLPGGEIFPAIPTVPELVKSIHDIAASYATRIQAETSQFVRAELQGQMLRDVFAHVETANPIKHPRAASGAWRAAGEEASSLLAAAGETSWLQRQIAERVNACYGKSKVLWTLLNLAEVPELTGMGFRLIDTQIHGLLYGKLDDGSLMLWEPSEGYDPADWKIGARLESLFRDGDPGKGGQFLNYMPAMKPMNGTAATPRDNARALADPGLPPPVTTAASAPVTAPAPADAARLEAAALVREAALGNRSGLTTVLDGRMAEAKDRTDGHEADVR